MNCESCAANGVDECDKGYCPEHTSYDITSRLCYACQRDIGGHMGANCNSCYVNGAGKCDSNGCPGDGVTYYNATTGLCEEEIIDRQCKTSLSSIL